MVERIEIFEVGPRDGLQNEKRPIATADKIALIDCLSDAGFSRIEVASLVDPKRVPQMADGENVLAGISRNSAVSYAALTPNMRGLERALSAGVDEIAVFGSASEGFSQSNIGCSISESFNRFRPVIQDAMAHKMKVRGYISCVTDCPFDGPTDPETVARIAADLTNLGCYEISLGDTIGKASPQSVSNLLAIVTRAVPAQHLAGHFHDTEGRALLNIEASIAQGVRVFDGAIGGLGGCPFAPGSPGNVATEAIHDHLGKLGFYTGLDRQVLKDAAVMANFLVGR